MYSLDVGLVQGHETRMNSQGHRSQMKVVKQHRQVIVNSTAGMEVELQDTRRGER